MNILKHITLSILVSLMVTAQSSAQSENRVIDQYIQLAEQNNPGLQAAYKQYQQALERVSQQKALPDPTLSAGVFINSIETRVGAQKAKLSISQMFPWFGTLDEKGQQAALQAQAIYESYLNTKNKLAYDVQAGWLDLYLIDRKIFYTKKRVEILDILEKQNLARFENNETGLVNVLYVQMLKEELLSKLELFTDKKRTLQTAFNLLLNQDAGMEIQLADTLLLPALPVQIGDSMWQDHPRLKAMDAQLEASQHREKAARLGGLPQIGIGLDYAIVAKRSDMEVSDNGKDALMPMVTVKIPLFRKKYKAAVKESQLQQEQFQFQKEQVNNQLHLEWKKALEDYNTGKRDSQLYLDLLVKARQSLEILTAKYETSPQGYEEVMNMQQKIWIYEQKQVEAQVNLHKSLAYLDYLSSK